MNLPEEGATKANQIVRAEYLLPLYNLALQESELLSQALFSIPLFTTPQEM